MANTSTASPPESHSGDPQRLVDVSAEAAGSLGLEALAAFDEAANVTRQMRLYMLSLLALLVILQLADWCTGRPFIPRLAVWRAGAAVVSGGVYIALGRAVLLPLTPVRISLVSALFVTYMAVGPMAAGTSLLNILLILLIHLYLLAVAVPWLTAQVVMAITTAFGGVICLLTAPPVSLSVLVPNSAANWVVAVGASVMVWREFDRQRRERVRITTLLVEQEARYRRLAETTAVIPWERDVRASQFTYVGPQAAPGLGYPIAAWYEPGFWEAHLHPQDRERAVALSAQQMQAHDAYELEYRMLAADGRVVWFRDFVSVTRDADGPTQLQGMLVDVSTERAAAAALRSAHQAKGEFLANMSHEIRTPLSAITGIAELMRTAELTPELKEGIDIIRSSSRALLTMVGDVLDVSKIEARQLTLDIAPFAPRDLIEQVARILEPGARHKGIALEVMMDDALPAVVLGDATRFEQITLNLVGNAIKFTLVGAVSVRLAPGAITGDTQQLFLEVSDTGIGIPLDRQPFVFEPFTQADGSMTRRFGGTGLGLTIARQLAELMGGQLTFESIEGRGSVFRCTVVVQRAPRDQLPITRPDRSVPLTGLRILLADDHHTNRAVVARLLERAGHAVVAVENGRDALLETGRRPFDVLLIDCQMPVMDGFAATAAIRANPDSTVSTVPIIALTALATQGERERCLAAGMTEYIAKPYEIEDLLALIDRVAAAGARAA